MEETLAVKRLVSMFVVLVSCLLFVKVVLLWFSSCDVCGFVVNNVSSLFSLWFLCGVVSTFAGCGANVSMYFGVKSKTRAIKKNASKVFLSILVYRITPTSKKRVAL